MVVRSLRAAALACAAVVGFGLAGAAEAATYFAYTDVVARPLDDTPVVRTESGFSASPVLSNSSSSYVSPGGDNFASSASSASAGPGVLKAWATASSTTLPGPSAGQPHNGNSAIGEGSALWLDSFILNAPGVAAGTQGTITADILINGFLSGAFEGSAWRGGAYWIASTSVNGVQYSYDGSLEGSPPAFPVIESGDPTGLYNPTFPVIFGQANSLFMTVTARATAGTGNPGVLVDTRSATFTSNFGNSLTWEGISGLTVGGVEVTEFSAVSSTSGFDFAQGFGAIGPGPNNPIPEPSTWATLILGFGLAGAALRTRPRVKIGYAQ